MEEKTLILVCGLPRSGKSTWAQAQSTPIVNPDAVRLALHGHTWIPEAEDFVWATVYVMARALFLAGHKVIIVDATNITEKRRNAWKLKFKDCKINLHVLKRPVTECIKQAQEDGRLDLVPVIERMAEAWDL